MGEMIQGRFPVELDCGCLCAAGWLEKLHAESQPIFWSFFLKNIFCDPYLGNTGCCFKAAEFIIILR